MSGADPILLLKGMAAYNTAVLKAATPNGKGSSLYPAVGYPAPGDLPCVVLFLGSPEARSIVEPDTDGAMWTVEISGQLLIANQGDTAKDIGAGDKLFMPLVDAYTVHYATGRNPAIDAINAGGPIDYLQLYSFNPGGVRYANQDYYGGSLFWRAKFHRYPEVTP